MFKARSERDFDHARSADGSIYSTVIPQQSTVPHGRCSEPCDHRYARCYRRRTPLSLASRHLSQAPTISDNRVTHRPSAALQRYTRACLHGPNLAAVIHHRSPPTMTIGQHHHVNDNDHITSHSNHHTRPPCKSSDTTHLSQDHLHPPTRTALF